MAEIWIDLLKILGGVIGTLGGVYLKKKLDRKDYMKQAILDKSAIYDEMRMLMNYTEFEGAVILKSHNGGGMPFAGSNLYLTAVDQDFSSTGGLKEVDFKKRYDSLEVNKPAVDLLKQMRLNNAVSIDVNELSPDNLLKGVSDIDEIKHIEIHHIYDSKDYMFALMLAKSDPGEVDNSSERARIEVAVQKMRKIYEKSYKFQ